MNIKTQPYMQQKIRVTLIAFIPKNLNKLFAPFIAPFLVQPSIGDHTHVTAISAEIFAL